MGFSGMILNLLLVHRRYGHALVTFDKKAEAKLRLKTDLFIIPTVFLLYLFCFIDRANIGQSPCCEQKALLMYVRALGNARLAGLEEGESVTEMAKSSDEC